VIEVISNFQVRSIVRAAYNTTRRDGMPPWYSLDEAERDRLVDFWLMASEFTRTAYADAAERGAREAFDARMRKVREWVESEIKQGGAA
jgi:hypothetical protein